MGLREKGMKIKGEDKENGRKGRWEGEKQCLILSLSCNSISCYMRW